MHPLVISRLIEAEYHVFIDTAGSNQILIVNKEGNIFKCEGLTASVSKEYNPIIRCPRPGINYIVAADAITKNVWLLPASLFESQTGIRLGKKYDDFLIPEPRSKEYQERKQIRDEYLQSLKDAAKQVAEVKGESE